MVYWVFFTDYFDVKNVGVEGNKTLTAEEILTVANVQIDSNLFLQDTWKMESDLKTAYPRIDSVDFKKGFPDTITVSVKEKDAVLLAFSPPNYLFVDGNGQIIDEMEELSEVTLPIFTSYYFKDTVEVGQLLVKKELKTAIDFMQDVPENKRYLVKEIGVVDGEIFIYPNSQLTVKLGSTDKMDVKLNTLETLLNDTTVIEGKVKSIDLTMPDKPIIKEK